jgi:hypothetical protein
MFDVFNFEQREVFLLSGKFDELRAAYAMSDGDLWQTLSRREGETHAPASASPPAP